MPPPFLVIRMVQEHKLLQVAVELLKIQTGTLLESSESKSTT